MNTKYLEPEPAARPRAARDLEFFIVSMAVVTISATVTIYFVNSMGGEMEMPGGWMISMMWMPMTGQTWPSAATLFMVMWLAMTVAMMLPSAFPMLLRYRRALFAQGEDHVDFRTALMACGYFLVWMAVGAVVYAAGAAVALAAMQWPQVSRVAPAISGLALVICGCAQFAPWKITYLRHCRDPIACIASQQDGNRPGPCRLGIKLGASCLVCCGGLMLTQIILGVMDLTLMAIVAVVIAMEKLLPKPELIVRIVGIILVATGMVIIGREVSSMLQCR
jgi:predicted metal-binding membrane protein